jgi:hypothetical protein
MESEMADAPTAAAIPSSAVAGEPLAAVAEEGEAGGEAAEAVGSTLTMERVAAAKKFIENHYRSQMKNIQERKERYPPARPDPDLPPHPPTLASVTGRQFLQLLAGLRAAGLDLARCELDRAGFELGPGLVRAHAAGPWPPELLNLGAYFRVVACGMQGSSNSGAYFRVVACGMLGTSSTSSLLAVNLEFLAY